MKRARRESAEVFYAKGPALAVDRRRLAELACAAAKAPRRRARLCLHAGPRDGQHDMLIVMPRGAYIRPHRHVGKTESYHVVSGRADMVEFDARGKIRRVISLGDHRSGLVFFFRVAGPYYHTLLIRSPRFAYHEATTGPFDRRRTLFPSWAPREGAPTAALFLKRTVRDAERRRK